LFKGKPQQTVSVPPPPLRVKRYLWDFNGYEIFIRTLFNNNSSTIPPDMRPPLPGGGGLTKFVENVQYNLMLNETGIQGAYDQSKLRSTIGIEGQFDLDGANRIPRVITIIEFQPPIDGVQMANIEEKRVISVPHNAVRLWEDGVYTFEGEGMRLH